MHNSNSIHTTRASDRDNRLGSALVDGISGKTIDKCPDLEQIAAMADGNLTELERDHLFGHMASCDRCRQVFLSIKSLEATTETTGSRTRWYLISSIAVAAAISVLILKVSFNSYPTSSPQVAVEKSTRATSQIAQVPTSTEQTTNLGVDKKAKQDRPLAVAAVPLVLITDEEAARPEAKNVGFARMPDALGPEIIINNPISDKETTGPVKLKINFVQKNTAVDLKSIKFKCLKSPELDLTERIRPYVTSKGLNIEQVKLPAGRYRFRIIIADINGRLSEKDLSVMVVNSF